MMAERPNKKSQSEKFREAAREVETDDDEKLFDEKLRRIAKLKEADLRSYYLAPVSGRENHPNWEASILEPVGCWVRAESEDDARLNLSLATGIAVEPRSHGDVVTSPWTDPSITTCEVGNPTIEVPEGIVVTDGGKTLTV